MSAIADGRREIRELRARVDQAFRLAQQHAGGLTRALAPPMDMEITDAGLEIALDLPGVAHESLQVRVEHGAVLVSGEKMAPEPGPDERVLRRERAYGPFSRAIPVPDEADLSQVTARLKDGELRITIGRKAEAAPRRIEVVVE